MYVVCVYAGIERELAIRADQIVLRRFLACGKNGWVSYGQKGVDGRSQWRTGTRPRLGWMDGVKVELGNRWMTVEAVRRCTKGRKEWRAWYKCFWMNFTRPFLLDSVFFRTALPCSGGYHLKRGGMPLHDAVGINCKRSATTEHQGAGVKYMG